MNVRWYNAMNLQQGAGITFDPHKLVTIVSRSFLLSLGNAVKLKQIFGEESMARQLIHVK
jgi:hypothetical protein